MTKLTHTPAPPYFAVIFTTVQSDNLDGYAETSDLMVELAKKQTGYLGIDSARSEVGITVSYWRDLESIKNWKMQLDHLEAQRLGKSKWYQEYQVRIAEVKRQYHFETSTKNS